MLQKNTLGIDIKIPLSSYIKQEFSVPTIQTIKI